ncbi:MAG: LPS-assembly protein LptD [Alphaproteobacteria bacterium]|nr:LPS-assembly protein LptD [Alphaproteobacteria bacterium]
MARFPFILLLALLCGSTFRASSAQAQILTGYDAPDVLQTSAVEPQQAPVSQIPETQAIVPSIEPLAEPSTAESSADSRTSQEPVDLQADRLEHDEQTRTVTASGNVFLTQAGRILRADSVSYNLATDEVRASGNVVLNEPNGDVHFFEEIQLHDKMKDGVVHRLKSYLVDGSRFTAREGWREGGTKTTMKDATYTPCEPCKENPDKPPVWQLRASEVTHDEAAKTISYRNARFEFMGVPLAYTPYFSHPDGTIKRKSGLLSPSAGYKSELGLFVENRYYWAIAPDKDATLGLVLMTEEAPMVTGEWRQRWDTASIELQGGLTYSGRHDSESGADVEQDEEPRGHIFAEGLWDINNKWRAGTNVEWASDDQYMRQYDLTDDDVLENEIYAERFSGRNYSVVRALTFQDIRVRDRQGNFLSQVQEDQPEVLPEMVTSFIGEPGAMPLLGGRWELDASFLGLQRSGDDPDMSRLSFNAGWRRRLVSDYGLVTTADVDLRSDFYNARDRAVAAPGSGRSADAMEARFFPQMNIQSAYPFVKPLESGAQAVIEPVVSLTAAPDVDVTDDIPNEDSRDVQIDASNLFEPNRFPGLDRVEDESRVTYGLRSGVYAADGSHGNVFIGQSFRFDDEGNPFPEGSGLNDRRSDVVGQVSANLKNRYNLNYRFQLDGSNLTSQRHEVDAGLYLSRFSLSSRYLFAKALEGTDINESREQLQADAAYYLSESWRMRTGGTQDLGATPGLRKAYVGLDYLGQCLSWSLTGERNLTDDSSGDSSTEVLFRIGLKNLGEFESSPLRPDSAK